MSKSNIFISSKEAKYIRRFDYYPYLWYRYHKLFLGSLIFRGRKLWAFNFFCNLKFEFKKREAVDPFWIFLIGLMKITPEVLLIPRKIGGKIQGVPLPISERKQYTFSVKWVIKLIRDKHKLITLNNIAETIIQAIYDKGDSYEKKRSIYFTSNINRHLIRYYRR
jgi:ribosomal protein S7